MLSDDPRATIPPDGWRFTGARLRGRASRLIQTRSFLALADQGIASASNFITVVLVGRHLGQHSFGAFSILWELQIFLNTLHAALVVYPLSVRGTRLSMDRLRQITTIGLILTVGLALPLGSAMLAAGIWQNLLTGALGATAIMAFQLHETLRRSLMSHFLYTKVIWGDAVAYLGMAGIVMSLAWFNALAVPGVFGAMTASFLLGSLVQAWWLRPSSAPREEIQLVALEFWTLGRWMLASNLTMLLTTVGVQWVLALFQDLTHVAKTAALGNMIRFTNPLITAMSGLIVPAVAREGDARAGVRYTLVGLVILMPYLLVLFAAPDFSIRVFYGNDSEYLGYRTELRVSVAACVTGYLGAMFLAILMGLGNSKANFWAQVANSIVSVGIIMPAAIKWGWTGTVFGGLIATVATLVMAAVLLRRELRRPHHPIAEL